MALRFKRIISFSLWGTDPLYNVGAIQNVYLARKHYPNWECRFYCGPDVPVLPLLWRLGCEVIEREPVGKLPLFWRFEAALDPDASFALFRDCDSRLNSRESAAVAEWINSGASLHTMHDSGSHIGAPIPGGMWGVRGGVLQFGRTDVERWVENAGQFVNGPDQDYLASIVWPELSADHYGHAADGLIPRLEANSGVQSYHPFPAHEPLEFGNFVGETIPVSLADLS